MQKTRGITAAIANLMDDTRLPQADQRSTALRLLLTLAMLVAATIFLWRGPWRNLDVPSDFILIYSPARAWLTGGNPYDMADVDRAWLDAGGRIDQAPTLRQAPGLLYPPTTLLGLAPFALLTWPAAHYAWIAANVACMAVALWCLARLAGFRAGQCRSWALVILSLLFAPVHTAMHHGQTPLYVMAFALLGLVVSRAVGGALTGFAAAIKPQIGLPMIALDIVQARWRSVIGAIIALALMALATTLPMTLRGINWRASWRDNIAAFRDTGAGDLLASNPDRHQLVNLQYPIAALTHDKTIAECATLIICAALAAAFFLPMKARAARMPLLLAASMVAVLTLMVTYHRFYDAALLLIPLTWAVARIAERRPSGIAWCVIVLLIPFFVNSATAMVWLADTGRAPAWLVDSWCWQHLLLPHQGWALLAMALCLLLGQRTGSADGRSTDRPAMAHGRG